MYKISLFSQIICWCFLISSLAACEFINPEEEIPAFLYVPDFELQTSPATQGSNSHKITEVWVSASNQFLGAFSLPAMIPILEMGATEISLQAGIKDNGIAGRPEIYPFYTEDRRTIELIPGQIDTIRPLITYREETRFALIEDFESDSHLFQELRLGADTNRIILTQQDVFEGNSSGTFFLDQMNPIVELATLERYTDLITKSVQVYLEVNYKSESPVIFGIIGQEQNNPQSGIPAYDPGFAPIKTWNKIYFNLSLLILENAFPEYQLSLQAFLPIQDGTFTEDNARVWLDNIKLVHF